MSTPERRNSKRRRRDNFELFAMLLGIGLVVVLVISVHFQANRLGHQQDGLKSLALRLEAENHRLGVQYTALVEACNRLQIVRVEDNLSHYADYLVFGAVLREFAGTGNSRFKQELEFAVRSKSWVPRTDCRRAVSISGARYRPPHPVSFAQRLPGKRDLTLPATDFR